jgi:tetratricopeptide (TPR) repeat protein
MAANHPEPHLLEQFLRGELDPPERRSIVRHLLGGCPACLEVTRRLWWNGPDDPEDGPEGDTPPWEYEAVFERLLRGRSLREQQVVAEQTAAPGLLEELLRQPRPLRLARVCSDERFRSLALCELLLARSRHASDAADIADAALALELAELALAVAERLDARLAGATLVVGTQARVWARLGETRRQAADLEGAERALATAELLLEKGEGDPLDEAELLELWARLRDDQRQRAEAARLLDEAAALYRAAGERHPLGRALLRKGVILARAGQGEEAAVALREGLSLVERHCPQGEGGKRGERLLVASALAALVTALVASGRAEEASGPLRELRQLQEEDGDKPALAGLRRLEGKAAEARGRFDEAETALIEAREGFLREDMGPEAALVSVELAVVYARQGRSPDLFALAQNMSAVYRAKDMRREVVAALIVFQRLAECDPGNIGFLVEVARYLGGSSRLHPMARWGG